MAGHASTLARFPLFQGVEGEALDQLAHLALRRSYGADEGFERSGEPPRGLYVLLEGTAVVVHERVGEPVQLLRRLRPGDCFGAASLLSEAPSTEIARTTTPCQVLLMPGQELRPLLGQFPRLRMALRRASLAQARASIEATLDLAARRNVRIRIDREVLLILEDSSLVRCRLENLSTGGAALEGAPENWQPPSVVTFELALPGRLPLLRARATVAWRRGRRVGLRFAAGDPRLANQVTTALAQLVPSRDEPPQP